jgi:hypothetical protein
MTQISKTSSHDAIVLSSTAEKDILHQYADHFQNNPLPPDELIANLGLFLTSKTLSRVLFFYEIYQKILHNHGIIVEFGVRWGQTLSLMAALRGIFEPFNRHRKIVGFDTFEGFLGVSEQDGVLHKTSDGSYSLPPEYDAYLQKLLFLQEQLNPISHLTKFELVRGDAVNTVPRYLHDHPETIISLAVLDFDIYRPTKAVIEAIRPHICKGSILVFDELCDDVFPGETIAVRETLGLNNLRVQRMPMTARISYVEIE